METRRDHGDDEWMASNVTMDILTNYTCLSPHFYAFLLKTSGYVLILTRII